MASVNQSVLEPTLDFDPSVALIPQSSSKANAEDISQSVRSYEAQLLFSGLPLFVSDLLSIGGSVLLTFTFFQWMWPAWDASPMRFLAFLSVGLPSVFMLFRLYPGVGLNPIIECRQVAIATIVLFTTFAVASLVHDGRQGYPLLLLAACAYL